MRAVSSAAFFLLLFSIASGAVIHVPDNQPTIQDAIAVAVPGDEIVVRPGTWAERIHFLGKEIVVRSEMGPLATVIDGGRAGSVVTFNRGEGLRAVLAGFTIRNGLSPQTVGGGIYCADGSSPTIAGNIIAGNGAARHGGGIYCHNGSSPAIVNNVIRDNVARETGGGVSIGIRSSPRLVNNTIVFNEARDFGGGINILFSTPEIVNTIVWGNRAAVSPEINVHSSSAPVIEHCNIGGLTATGKGNFGGDPRFANAAAKDFSLTLWSPCINRGTNDRCPARDIAGDPRPTMGMCDVGADEFTGDHALGADLFSLSASAGGKVHLSLFGGAPAGGRNYLLLGSLSGTTPGIALPGGGGAVLPLNADPLMRFVYRNLNGPHFRTFRGTLTWGSSTGAAVLDTLGPVPAMAGRRAHFAFVLEAPLDTASNPIAVDFLP